MMPRKRLLVLGSGGRPFREYVLRGMARRADLVLVDQAEPTWQRPYVVESHRVEPGQVAGMLERLDVDGVVTYDESQVLAAAALAARLGRGATDPAAVARCKDKFAFRECLAAAGLSPVGYGMAATLAEAREIAGRLGYPLVCKPPALGGSVGAVRVDDDAALADAFAVAAGANYFGLTSEVAGVLVEEFLDGPEYSVDAVTWEGVTHPLVIADKELAYPPYFEEAAHVVPAAPRRGLDDAVRLVAEAHRVIGVDRLVTHSEFKLTSKGPRLVEINARLGGDLIPYLGLLASGCDLAAAAADVAVGQAPELSTERSEVASVLMIYPPRSCRFEDLTLRRDRADYPGLVDFVRIQEPGTELRLPPEGFLSRAGFAVVTGPTREECLTRRQAVAEDVVVTGSPLDAA